MEIVRNNDDSDDVATSVVAYNTPLHRQPVETETVKKDGYT